MKHRRRRLWTHLTVGTAAGILYSMVDLLFDAQLQHGRLGALGPLHEFLDHVLPVATGTLLGAVIFASSQRARLVELERRRAEALRLRVEKIERDQAVWVLAATILHEVKNPLHSLGLLLDEVAANRAASPELVERAQAQIARISNELGLLRSLPRRDDAQPEPLRLDEVAASLAEELRPVLHGVEVKVVASAPVFAVGDAARLRLVLENLVENGAQAARGQQAARVEVSVENEGQGAVLQVRDNGPGPAPEAVPHMFDPLHSSKPSGLGLGLAVSRALARAMRGELTYSGQVDGWTTFRLELPASAA